MKNLVIRELNLGLTPWEIFQIFKEYPAPFFLDSALNGNNLSRYSFLGIEPFMTIKLNGQKIFIQDNNGTVEVDGDPFELLGHFLNKFEIEDRTNLWKRLDIPFIGGAVGYFSYDLCHFIETLPDTKNDDIGFPEMRFGFYDTIVAFDHLTDKSYVVSINLSGNDSLRPEKKMERMIKIIQDKCIEYPDNYYHRVTKDMRIGNTQLLNRESLGGISCNFSKKAYIETIKRAKEYIMAGDIYQVNLSQRFQTRTGLSPFKLYERLRMINPAPFSSFISFENLHIISSSPERFLATRIVDTQAGKKLRTQIRPIKGTRPRDPNKSIDERIKAELLASPKDEAELTMIIDLERNDLGRVCDYGSVKVVGKKLLESYATVHHLVATIEGDLNNNHSIIDLIRATFPGGSVTGAPKIRAMEIIDELEPTRRSVYTGAIGYLSFDGNVDLSMAIRTILMNGDQVYFQVGGAIVADSDPLNEYDETLHKASALMKAVGELED